jgi:hypothetical protein
MLAATTMVVAPNRIELDLGGLRKHRPSSKAPYPAIVHAM